MFCGELYDHHKWLRLRRLTCASLIHSCNLEGTSMSRLHTRIGNRVHTLSCQRVDATCVDLRSLQEMIQSTHAWHPSSRVSRSRTSRATPESSPPNRQTHSKNGQLSSQRPRACRVQILRRPCLCSPSFDTFAVVGSIVDSMSCCSTCSASCSERRSSLRYVRRDSSHAS